MNKRKIVVGDNFLHAHIVKAGTVAADHVVVDHYDWKMVVNFFTDELSRTDELRSYVAVRKDNTEQPIGESQKCDQGSNDPTILTVIPREEWLLIRLSNLLEAIRSRVTPPLKLPIPEDWVKEYNELLLMLKK